MRKLLLFVAVLTLMSMPFIAFAQAENAAVIRFVHVLNGAPDVDVYVDGSLVYASLEFGEASPYLAIAPGAREITVTAAGETDSVWSQSTEVVAGQALVAIVSSDDALSFTIFNDDLNPLPVGRARLTAIHAIPDAPAVDIVLADGRPVIPNLQYNQPYGTLDIPSQAYSLVVLPTGGTLDQALLPETVYALSTGTSYIVIAYGTPSEPMTLVLSAPTLADDETAGYVRVVHAAEGAAAVDVRADDALIIPALDFGGATEYIALPAGDYEVSLSATGSTDALVTAEVTIESGTRTTVVASAAGGSAVLSTFTADTAVVPAFSAVFTLSNLVANTTASASFSNGEAIVPSVEADDFVSTAIQPGLNDIVVTANFSELSIEGNFDTAGIYGGVLYESVVYPGEAQPQVLILPLVSLPLTASASAPTAVAQVPEATPAPTESVVFATSAPNTAATATPTPQAQVAEGGATQDPNIVQAVPGTTSTLPTARVILDPGANLHLRQYPGAEAFSLGLAPSGTVFRVLGREGAPEPPSFFTPTPTPEGAASPTPFIDPVTLLGEDEDLDPRATWLFVEFDTPDGGVITAWVNALYLEVRDPRGNLLDLRELPMVPRNRAGEQRGQAPGVAPTQNPLRNVNVATVQGLQPGANLHFRRRANAQSESLALLPNGTQLIVLGRNEAGDWLQVEYQDQIGWIAVPYARVTFNDRTVDLVTIPVVETTTNGTPGANSGAVEGIGGVPTDAPGDESGD